MSTTNPENSRSRVAHIVLQLDTGGMERLLVEFARHADRSRFDLRFVSLTTRGRVADEIEALGWPVECLKIRSGLRPGLVWRLSTLFKAWGTDVVHAHNTKPLLYAAPAARLAHVPRMIYTRHGQRHGASRKETWLYRLAAKFVDGVACVSRDGAERSIREGINPDKVVTVWNGIDTSRFSYTGPRAKGPVVMVGRLSPEKDVETLLKAAAIAVANEPDIRFEIAGDGQCMADLKESARTLGVDHVVTFLGNVRDVAGLLQRASLSTLSSVTEGISLTLLEAMSRGLPVVATRVGGNPEVVAEGETGLLVPSRDPALLAEAILAVWRNPEMGAEMGLAGRRRVEAHFDVRQMVAKYEQLYRKSDVKDRPLRADVCVNRGPLS